jgi:hypothetical protein
MKTIRTLTITAILLGLSTTYAATLLLNGAQSFSDSPSNAIANSDAVEKAKIELSISTDSFEYTPTTSRITLAQAYNFNFVQWYLNNEINLADLLDLAVALTSLHNPTDDESPDSIWKTPLVLYNLAFSKALLALFQK